MAPGLLIGQVQEFKIKEIKEIDTFREHVREIKFSPFGMYIAVTSGDNTVSLYNHEYQLLWSSQGDPKNYGGIVHFLPMKSTLRSPGINSGEIQAYLTLRTYVWFSHWMVTPTG